MNADELRTALHDLADLGVDADQDLVPGVRRLAARRRRTRAGIAALAIAAAAGGGALGLHASGSGGRATLVPAAPPSHTAAPPSVRPSASLPPDRAAAGSVDSLVLSEAERTAISDSTYARYVGENGLTPTKGLTRADFGTASHVYYGVVYGVTPAQDTYWAVGDQVFRDPAGLGAQDQPFVWRRVGAGSWVLLTDTGGAPPCSTVPMALLRAWSYPGITTSSVCKS